MILSGKFKKGQRFSRRETCPSVKCEQKSCSDCHSFVCERRSCWSGKYKKGTFVTWSSSTIKKRALHNLMGMTAPIFLKMLSGCPLTFEMSPWTVSGFGNLLILFDADPLPNLVQPKVRMTRYGILSAYVKDHGLCRDECVNCARIIHELK